MTTSSQPGAASAPGPAASPARSPSPGASGAAAAMPASATTSTAPMTVPAAMPTTAWHPAGDPAAAPAGGGQTAGVPSTMPRDLRRLRAAAPIACALTGIAASGFLGTTGLQASPVATTQQLAHATQAKQAFQRADLAAAQIVAGRALGATPTNRTTYDESIRSVGSSLVAAADAAPGAQSLTDAAAGLTAYTAAVERAIAAPAKSATAVNDYLRAAQTARNDVLAPIDRVAADGLERLSGGGGAASRPGGILLVLLIGGGSTIGLGMASWWLARKTHRIINPGLAVATVMTAGLTFFTLVPSARPGYQAGGAVEEAKSVAALRDNAYAARAAEVQRLMPGTDTAEAERVWQERRTDVARGLRTGLAGPWAAYSELHGTLAAADTPAERAEAMAGSGEAFDTFMDAVDRQAAASQRRVDQAVTQPATITAGVALAAGLSAAALAWAGVGRRLEEYR